MVILGAFDQYKLDSPTYMCGSDGVLAMSWRADLSPSIFVPSVSD